ncbi:hypothetical protein A259_38041, partial [Pseudomonas syringae pv. actinidiae ICMP 19070]
MIALKVWLTACIFPPAISFFLIMNFIALNLPDYNQTENSTATKKSGGAQDLAMELLFISDIRL